jgi:hypothetical protein
LVPHTSVNTASSVQARGGTEAGLKAEGPEAGRVTVAVAPSIDGLGGPKHKAASKAVSTQRGRHWNEVCRAPVMGP